MTLFFLMLSALMLLVVALDASKYLIPNWLVGMVLALYPVFVLMAPVPVDWPGALLVFGAFFVVGIIIFALRWVGGGDVKLLMALSLWVGTTAWMEFLLLVAILGGALAVALMVGRPCYAFLLSKLKNPPGIPKILTVGAPLPYGLAIAAAFLWLLWGGKLPGLAIS